MAPNLPENLSQPGRTIMSELMTPNDANFLGKVFGGRLLALIDLCAYTTAARYTGHVCVTASFDRVDFHEPIEVGEVITLDGTVTYTGRTSVEVTIEVTAENIFARTRRHTNTARVTMVAIQDGRPVPVPSLQCKTRDEKILFLAGKLRRELRSSLREHREALESKIRSFDDAKLDDLLQHREIAEHL